jgi:hypothetical protein
MMLQVNYDLYRARTLPMPRRLVARAAFEPARRARHIKKNLSRPLHGVRKGRGDSKSR